MQKPDGLVMLRQEELPGRLLDLKLTDMPGIGYNMDKRLRRAGITDMRGLWNTSPKHARKIWGGVQGERFWYWLHGYDFENPETGNVMIGHSRVLDPDLRRPDKARLMARRLLVKATYRLRRKGFFASHLSLSVRTTDGFRWANEAKISHARDPFTFLQLLDSMWASLSHEFPVASGVKFKKISVILSGLKTADQITGSLFETASPEAIRQTHRREALAGALDKLQNKYQKETVWLGVIPKTSAGHVGTKIAFSRVPDREEFWN
jgi:DNA polymerase-4